MQRRDLAVLAGLSAILLLAALSIGLPSPGAPAARLPSQWPTQAPARPYVEGLVGPIDQVSPLSARTQAERNVVALVFSGLVRLGPDDSVVPDLADSWEADATGAHWTFHIRSDAVWHDGASVIADDVVFTVNTLRSTGYAGAGGASWREVTATAVDPSTVRFDLATPLGGFLQAATQPIVPLHLLDGKSAAALSAPTSPFGRQPVGSGPYRLVTLGAGRVQLVPVNRPSPSASTGSSARASASPAVDTLRTDAPPFTPPRPISLLTAIEFRVFESAGAVAAAYRAGDLDAASGLPPALIIELAQEPATRLLRYPGSTLSAVMLNLRRAHPEFRDAAVRRALLTAIDRDLLVADSLGGLGIRADSLIPASSWAFDPEISLPVPHDPASADAALRKVGWTKVTDAWRPSGFGDPLVTELLSATAESSPIAFALAEAVAADWRQLGLAVTHVGLPPAELSSTRLRAGDFDAALLSVNIGLDPDLYPLLASTQTTTSGSNVIGIQDQGLDKLLAAARGPGTLEARRAAYAALQKQLGAGVYVLPLAFRDVVVVVSDELSGPVVRPLGDPADRFWDVLTWRLAIGR